MIRIIQITVLICITILPISCKFLEKEKPIWEQVKISDLVTSSDVNNPEGRPVKTINIDIHTFEMSAKDTNTFNYVQQMLYTKPLHFNDYEAFKANSFSASFGQIQMWNSVANILRNAGSKHLETVSLLLPNESKTSDFTITRLNKKQTIFYISTNGSMEGATVGPGELVLRIRAEKIPGSKGVCNVSATPVFTLTIQSPIPQLAEQAKSKEFLFASTGFHLKMSPGDFVLLGPEKYTDNQITLGSLFFSIPKPKPTIRMFLLICTRIID